jgi:D-beta-D-heptose 7-phosphate kinase/D-beta-D-heptose 1-phosphate adenosyltransferase
MQPQQVLDNMRGRRVLVIGDLMLDDYIWGTAERISPEAPVPIVRYERRTSGPGGAANVVRNIQSLGGEPIVCGVVGDDEGGRILREQLEDSSSSASGIFVDAHRVTTQKTRVMAHHQQIVRIDRETTEPVSADITERLLSFANSVMSRVDVVVFSDYDKGIAHPTLLRGVARAAAAQGKPFVAGPKPRNVRLFSGATLLSLNKREAAEVIRADLHAAGQQMLTELNLTALVITRSEEGASLFERGKEPAHIPASRVEVFDVAGAGDTFLSATTLALAAGCDFEQAARLGNLAGAAAVRHIGVVAVTPQDVLGVWNGGVKCET